MNSRKQTFALIIAILSIAFGFLMPAKLIAQNDYKHYVGTINNSIKVRMSIVITDTKISGNYFYEKVGYLINISGTIDKNGNFSISETNSDGIVTGTFTGKSSNLNELTGVWQNAKKDKSFPFSFVSEASDAIQFKAYAISGIISLTNIDSLPAYSYEYKVLYPTDNDNNLAYIEFKRILDKEFFKLDYSNKSILTKLQESINSSLKHYKEMEKDFTENPDNATFYNWDVSYSSTILFNDFNIVTYCIDSYEYLGGAHGLGTSQYIVFDIKNAKQLKLSDIFQSGFENQIKELLLKKMREQQGVKTNSELEELGYSLDGIKPTDNFFVIGAGIGFFYNSYEIAPYVMGATEIILPFKDLKSLLKTQGNVFPLVK